MRITLRIKLLIAILAAVILSDGVATWVVQNRLLAGAQREASRQAQAEVAQVRAVYNERVATLAAEGEAISLYPAVIAAIADGNVQPLRLWSAQVAALQSTSVTVTDASGRVIARGHAPDQTGDNLASTLDGLRRALAGQEVTGAESGDEIGLAVRSYVPVRRNNAVVGTVMLTDPLDDRLLHALAGSETSPVQIRVESTTAVQDLRCDPAMGASATCHFALSSPTGTPAAALAVTVPLTDIERATANARHGLWFAGLVVLAVGVAAAWLLAGSLSRPLARLTAAAGRVAAGDYDRPVEVRSTDEIGVLARAFDVMRQEVARSTRALRDERDVRDAVLESAGDGILMVGPSGATVVVNTRWAALAGGDGLAAIAGLERFGKDGGTFADAVALWLADAAFVGGGDFERFAPYRRFRCYTAPVRDRAGATLGHIFVLRDVTQESVAERMRSAFVATVSHELRSPLTAIAGYTDTLLQGGPWDEATQRELLEIVSHAAATLSRLVDNLLDASQMDAGVLALEREPVRVERIVQRLIGHRQALAPEHPLALEADPGLPLVDADPFRTEQVLTNLIDNAIKYSPTGGPVTVRITADDDVVTVRVSDRGIGIPPAHVARLFERFYRVENSQTTKGIGLGLFICKSIVEAHGGHIWVESTRGEGSTFAFTLPRLVDVEAADAPRTTAIAREGRGATALLREEG